ncbi:hypothetical protein IGI04_018756 [Brassica rapa subsp. trilocularis]|uniref:Uncharacterized protein n=1 Tax=Brassica rapa subsp. trilocularis TaxID=1813537 RepID=A0ABQ7MEB0_BRACM|nr:hypothetical protein IGI04_018756 [Brassica rapa subsp. trilocularis]
MAFYVMPDKKFHEAFMICCPISLNCLTVLTEHFSGSLISFRTDVTRLIACLAKSRSSAFLPSSKPHCLDISTSFSISSLELSLQEYK